MFLFLQLHFGLFPTPFAVLVEFSKICFFALQDTHSAGSHPTFGACAGVDSFLSSWHSWSSLLKKG